MSRPHQLINLEVFGLILRGTTEAAKTKRQNWVPSHQSPAGWVQSPLDTMQRDPPCNLLARKSQAKKDLRRISLNDMNHDKRHISERFWRKKKQKFPILFPADTSTSSHMQIPISKVEIPHPGGSNLTQRRGLRSLLDRGSHGNVGLNAKRHAKVKGSLVFFSFGKWLGSF